MILERQVRELQRRQRRDQRDARPQPAGHQAHRRRVDEAEGDEGRHGLGKADPGEVDRDRTDVAARVAGARRHDQHGGQDGPQRLRAAGGQAQPGGGVAIHQVDDQRGGDRLRDEVGRGVELGAESVRFTERARHAAVDHVGGVARHDRVARPQPAALRAQGQCRHARERVQRREQILHAEHPPRARMHVHVEVDAGVHAAPRMRPASSESIAGGADASACKPSIPSATSARCPA